MALTDDTTPPDWLLDPAHAVEQLVERVGSALAPAVQQVGPRAGLAAAAAVATVIAWRWRVRVALRRDGRRVVIFAPPVPESAGAAALWLNLHDLLRPAWKRAMAGQPHLAWEYIWSQEGLEIAMWVPAAIPPGLVERAIEAAWPGSRTETRPAAPPLPETVATIGGSLRLSEADWFPLRTDHDSDALRPLLGAAATANEGERVVVQVVARPATGRAVARCRRAARELRAPAPTPVAGGRRARRPGVDPTVAPDVRVILDKADGPLWQATVRYAVACSGTGARSHARLRGRAHAVASAFGVYAGRNHLRRHRLARPAATIGRRALGQASMLSGSELAALAHLPTDALVPGLARAGARAVPPPVRVPRGGTGVKIIGDADAGPARAAGLTAEDSRYHLHVMGATGSGKSTLLANLVLQDVDAGRGTVVVDPKGDLITDIVRRLPKRHRDGAVILDPQSKQSPPTLNMLEVPEGVDSDLVVDHLVGIFHKIFEHHWGPRTDEVLRAACLTLVRRPGQSLADIPDLLVNPDARAKFTQDLDETEDAALRGFWAWYDAQSDAQRSQIIGSPLNKLRAFLLRGFVRQIVAAERSSIDTRAVLDGGLLLVRVPKGLLGDDTARLLGSFVVARVWQAATGRSALGEAVRADASLYVDECHNFLSLPNSVSDMLAEARGYRLSMILAHQHLGQMPRELRDAISANARNKILFTMSPEDAHVLARHVAPDLTDHDLSHLAAYQAACRLVVSGEDQSAFTVRTRTMPAEVAA